VNESVERGIRGALEQGGVVVSVVEQSHRQLPAGRARVCPDRECRFERSEAVGQGQERVDRFDRSGGGEIRDDNPPSGFIAGLGSEADRPELATVVNEDDAVLREQAADGPRDGQLFGSSELFGARDEGEAAEDGRARLPLQRGLHAIELPTDLVEVASRLRDPSESGVCLHHRA